MLRRIGVNHGSSRGPTLQGEALKFRYSFINDRIIDSRRATGFRRIRERQKNTYDEFRR